MLLIKIIHSPRRSWFYAKVGMWYDGVNIKSRYMKGSIDRYEEPEDDKNDFTPMNINNIE